MCASSWTSLAPLFPPEVAEFLGGQLVEMADKSKSSLRISAAASLCFGIWGASKGIRALLHTLGSGAPGGDPRGRVGRGVRALALAASAVVVVTLAVATMIVVPAVLAALGRAGAASRGAPGAALAGAGAGGVRLAGAALPLSPRAGQTPWRWTLLGAAVATGLWLLGSVAFSTFVAQFRKRGHPVRLAGRRGPAAHLVPAGVLRRAAGGGGVRRRPLPAASRDASEPSDAPGVRPHPSAGMPRQSR